MMLCDVCRKDVTNGVYNWIEIMRIGNTYCKYIQVCPDCYKFFDENEKDFKKLVTNKIKNIRKKVRKERKEVML